MNASGREATTTCPSGGTHDPLFSRNEGVWLCRWCGQTVTAPARETTSTTEETS